MQGGRFDVPDRLFGNIAETYRMCSKEIADVRELTSEMYFFPEILINKNYLDLGVKQTG